MYIVHYNNIHFEEVHYMSTGITYSLNYVTKLLRSTYIINNDLPSLKAFLPLCLMALPRSAVTQRT